MPKHTLDAYTYFRCIHVRYMHMLTLDAHTHVRCTHLRWCTYLR